MGERSDVLNAYIIKVGTAQFEFTARESEDMLLFVAYAIKHIDKASTPMDETITIKRDYFYEDEIEGDFK